MDHIDGFLDPRKMNKKELEFSTPAELFDLYDETMKRIHESKGHFHDLAVKALSWVFRTRQPLSELQLRQAIAIRDGDTDLTRDDLSRLGDIIAVCRGLLRHEEGSGTVILSHEQVYQYLIQRSSTNTLLTEVDLSIVCLTSLLFDIFDGEVSPNVPSFKERWGKYEFGVYSALHWGSHAKGEGEDDPKILDLMQRVFRSQQRIDVILQVTYAYTDPVWETKSNSRVGNIGNSPLHLLAFSGLTKVLKRCLTSTPDISSPLSITHSDLMVINKSGWTPLHWAAHHGDVEMLRVLINEGANVVAQAVNKFTALSMAASLAHYDAIRYLLNVEIERYGLTGDQTSRVKSLLRATGRDHVEVVKILLDAQADVPSGARPSRNAFGHSFHANTLKLFVNTVLNSTDGLTALHVAALEGSLKTCKLLLKAEADPRIKGANGCTPLAFATFYRHGEIARLLVDAGADVNAETENGSTALHMACQNGDHDLAQYLLNKNANVQTNSMNGVTPLHLAAGAGHAQIVMLLLHAGAQLLVKDKNGLNPFHYAAAGGHPSVIETLLSYSAERGEEEGRLSNENSLASSQASLLEIPAGNMGEEITALTLAVTANQERAVEVLLKANANTKVQSPEGYTPLHIASLNGFEAIVKQLLRVGADVSGRSNTLQTPLHVAATKNNVSIIRQLLDAGSDVSSRDHLDLTPLHNSSFHGFHDVMEVLLKSNANILAQDSNLRSPLYYASINGFTRAVDLLLDPKLPGHDMLVSIVDKSGLTALHAAAGSNRFEIVAMLLKAKADVSIRAHDGTTALYYAAARGHSHSARLLLEAKSDVSITRDVGWTSLHQAAWNGHEEVVDLLLGAHADPQTETQEGLTALILAAEKGHRTITSKLLDIEPPPNGSTRGASAFHRAALLGLKNAIKTLLSENVSVGASDENGNTALHFASASCRLDMIEYLVESGADPTVGTKSGLTPILVAANSGHATVVRYFLAHFGESIDNQSLHCDTSDRESARTTLLEYLHKIYPKDQVCWIWLLDAYKRNKMLEKLISVLENELTRRLSDIKLERITDVAHRYRCDRPGCTSSTPIRGYCHMCTVCPDFEVCHACAEGIEKEHPNHCFVVIPSQQWVKDHLVD
jgi:ankyrin repeat protein